MTKSTKTKMKFNQDMFVDEGDGQGSQCKYTAGHVYQIETESVERWLKRGGVIVGTDGKPVDQEVLEVETEVALAEELEAQNKIDEQEVEDAKEHEEEVKEDHDHEDDHGKKNKKKKKH